MALVNTGRVTVGVSAQSVQEARSEGRKVLARNLGRRERFYSFDSARPSAPGRYAVTFSYVLAPETDRA